MLYTIDVTLLGFSFSYMSVATILNVQFIFPQATPTKSDFDYQKLYYPKELTNNPTVTNKNTSNDEKLYSIWIDIEGWHIHSYYWIYLSYFDADKLYIGFTFNFGLQLRAGDVQASPSTTHEAN